MKERKKSGQPGARNSNSPSVGYQKEFFKRPSLVYQPWRVFYFQLNSESNEHSNRRSIRIRWGSPQTSSGSSESESRGHLREAKRVSCQSGHAAAPGSLDGLVFEKSDPEAIAARDDIECVFLAVPHGVAAEYAGPIARSQAGY